MESHQQEMVERMTALLPAEAQQTSRNSILPRRGETFEVLYHLHFDNLCSDFREDLRFRFSLGFTALLNRFLSSGRRSKGYGEDTYEYDEPYRQHTSLLIAT